MDIEMKDPGGAVLPAARKKNEKHCQVQRNKKRQGSKRGGSASEAVRNTRL